MRQIQILHFLIYSPDDHTEPRQNQEPGTKSGSPTRQKGPNHLIHHQLPPRVCAGVGTQALQHGKQAPRAAPRRCTKWPSQPGGHGRTDPQGITAPHNVSKCGFCSH